MPAIVKRSELTLHSPVTVDFGFSGLEPKYAQAIMRDILRDSWPEQRRWKQSVYSIRLVGEVAVHYPRSFSPVVYIGEGNAFGRIYNHVNWIVPLLLSVPQLSIQVRVLEVARRNNAKLYSYLEADLLRAFSDRYGALPWFNRQWERGREGVHTYEPAARKVIESMIEVGSGSKYVWAIRPTHNNDQHEPYHKGICE